MKNALEVPAKARHGGHMCNFSTLGAKKGGSRIEGHRGRSRAPQKNICKRIFKVPAWWQCPPCSEGDGPSLLTNGTMRLGSPPVTPGFLLAAPTERLPISGMIPGRAQVCPCRTSGRSEAL